MGADDGTTASTMPTCRFYSIVKSGIQCYISNLHTKAEHAAET